VVGGEARRQGRNLGACDEVSYSFLLQCTHQLPAVPSGRHANDNKVGMTEHDCPPDIETVVSSERILIQITTAAAWYAIWLCYIPD
jgi:hypothetical protein